MVRVPIHMLFLCPEGGYSHCGPGLCKGHAAYRVPHPHSFGLTSQGAQASSHAWTALQGGIGGMPMQGACFPETPAGMYGCRLGAGGFPSPQCRSQLARHFRLHPSQGTHASSHAWMALQGGIGGSRQDACFPETPAGMYGCRLGAGGFPSPQCRSQLARPLSPTSVAGHTRVLPRLGGASGRGLGYMQMGRLFLGAPANRRRGVP